MRGKRCVGLPSEGPRGFLCVFFALTLVDSGSWTRSQFEPLKAMNLRSQKSCCKASKHFIFHHLSAFNIIRSLFTHIPNLLDVRSNCIVLFRDLWYVWICVICLDEAKLHGKWPLGTFRANAGHGGNACSRVLQRLSLDNVWKECSAHESLPESSGFSSRSLCLHQLWPVRSEPHEATMPGNPRLQRAMGLVRLQDQEFLRALGRKLLWRNLPGRTEVVESWWSQRCEGGTWETDLSRREGKLWRWHQVQSWLAGTQLLSFQKVDLRGVGQLRLSLLKHVLSHRAAIGNIGQLFCLMFRCFWPEVPAQVLVWSILSAPTSVPFETKMLLWSLMLCVSWGKFGIASSQSV